MNYCLAIDIGASGGRHILGGVEDGRLVCKEVYRFENNIAECGGTLTWDTDYLTRCVLEGIKRCGELGMLPDTVAIDTWGVDYVLLDADGKEILPAVSYRDSRTAEVQKEVEQLIGEAELYKKTGIQKQSFNTIYQLFCDKKSGKLAKAEHFLMLPDYLSFKLTGVMKNEYTNATTTGLVNAETGEWDAELLGLLGIKSTIFKPLAMPSDGIGRFTDEVKKLVGFDCEVVFCPSHDTASAIAACPLTENGMYISSGTWSLIGTERAKPILSDAARRANFTNEGGIDKKICFLKNIMGMWLFQNIRKNLDKKYSYNEMMELAMQSGYTKKIDPNDTAFVAPKNMIFAIRSYLGDDALPLGDVLSSVYHSLADTYAKSIAELEEITGTAVDSVCIVGGGSKDSYLNRLTKQYSGKRVFTGATEATATGNLIAQLMHLDRGLTLKAARELVKQSLSMREIAD